MIDRLGFHLKGLSSSHVTPATMASGSADHRYIARSTLLETLPEVCANLAFGGPKRDRLFMAASTSLFVYQTTTQGAAPG
jgi:sugar lactone lactonase YvrE